MSELSIGIDFGTTKTLATFYSKATRRPLPVRLGEGRDDIPTSIYVTENDEFLFGQDADDAAEHGEAFRYSRAFKMKLGASSPVLLIINEGHPLKKYTARELTSIFLKHIKTRCEKEVEEFMGKNITHVVITRPVSFSPAQCDELKAAAEEAGFSKIELITEPEAAGYAFCHLCPSEAFEGNALVVDWGGGTLDMALVTRREGQISTHREHTGGNVNMGGEVFDERLWEHVLSRLPEQDRKDIAEEKLPHQFRMLRRVRQDKEGLSGQIQRTVRLIGNRSYNPVLLEREEFENLIREDVEQAGTMAKQLIAGIQGQSRNPELLLLVGGTSKIPAISAMMGQATGLPCRTWQFSREAVGLGAALIASGQKGQSRATQQDIPEEKEKSPEPKVINHTLELSTHEMKSGCVKNIEIQGKTLEVRIPPGISSGTKLRLPAPKTQGLGEILTHIKLLPSSPSSEKPLYVQGLEYLHGINGKDRDFVQAAKCFAEGHEKGDLNAMYMLCHCYVEGIGIPRDFSFAYQLAQFLVDRYYYPAFYFLADAWRNGYGVPMDQHKADRLTRELEEKCASPIQGVDEILRYDALLNSVAGKEDIDYREYERLARANLLISNLPERYPFLAVVLLKDISGSPSAQKEVRNILDEGSRIGDDGCLFLKGLLLLNEDSSVYTPNKYEGIQLIEKAAQVGRPSYLFHLALNVDSETRMKALFDKFWRACCLGVSLLKGPNELNCLISVKFNSIACLWDVYEAGIAVPRIDRGEFDQLVRPTLPIISIKNENSHTLHNLKVRICSSDSNLDRTLEGVAPLASGEELEIDPFDYNLNLGEKLYMEVRSGERFSVLDLEILGGLSDFTQTPPPLALWWERGTFGGFVLKIACLEGEVNQLIVHKGSGVKSAPVSLKAGQGVASVGWCEFSDSTGLKENEGFYISCAEYNHIVGAIRSSANNNPSSNGWVGGVAALGLGFLEGALSD